MGPYRSMLNAAGITYSWNAPRRIGLFTLEDLQNGAIHQAVFQAPIPLPLFDAAAIMQVGGTVHVDDRICALALSDRIEPVGRRRPLLQVLWWKRLPDLARLRAFDWAT